MSAVSCSSQQKKHVVIYTDGACSGNPGPGGWGALLKYGDVEKELSGGDKDTTNNRMELLAAIKALEALKTSCQVDLYTDSEYVRKGITQWITKWKSNNWKTAHKKEVKNKDLWVQIDSLVCNHDVTFHWVKGHSGDVNNERVDKLAVEAIPARDI